MSSAIKCKSNRVNNECILDGSKHTHTSSRNIVGCGSSSKRSITFHNMTSLSKREPHLQLVSVSLWSQPIHIRQLCRHALAQQNFEPHSISLLTGVHSQTNCIYNVQNAALRTRNSEPHLQLSQAVRPFLKFRNVSIKHTRIFRNKPALCCRHVQWRRLYAVMYPLC